MRNRLTFFLDLNRGFIGHGFVGLECENCADGKPAELHAGFYPNNERQFDREMIHVDNQQPVTNIHKKLVSGVQSSVKAVAPFMIFDYPVPFSLTIPLSYFKDGAKHYMILNDGPTDGKTIYNATQGNINFLRHSVYFNSDLENMYRVSYEINDDDACKVWQTIRNLAENSYLNYEYSTFKYNCVDFTREIYQQTSLGKKTMTGIYNLNPLASLVGVNGMSGSYMLAKDVYEISTSNPAFALCAGSAMYGLYKWASNKLSRRRGSRFFPAMISNDDKGQHLNSISETIKILSNTIDLLLGPVSEARNAVNDCYGVASRKTEYAQLRADYVELRDLLEGCENALEKSNQLLKDYNSLSTEYSSINYAKKVISEIETLSKYAQVLANMGQELCKHTETSPGLKR